MNIARFEDWPERLNDYLHDCETRAFLRGRHDCALFAAGAVEAMTGKDFGAKFRAGYDDRRGASRALKKHGAGTLFDTATLFLGAPLAHPKQARRGDIVGLELEDGPTLGVCTGAAACFAAEPSGLTFIPLSAWTAPVVWRV